MPDPSLDRTVVRRLGAVGYDYHGTHWSTWRGQWEHRIAGPHQRAIAQSLTISKTDAGITALLEYSTRQEDDVWTLD
jgi:hypothetical protein